MAVPISNTNGGCTKIEFELIDYDYRPVAGIGLFPPGTHLAPVKSNCSVKNQ